MERLHTGRSTANAALRPAQARRPVGHSAGFTLMELMIVVAIVGILAAIAYPAYTNSIIKGNRSQGRAALLDLMQQEERYLTQHGAYAIFLPGATNVPFKTTSGDGTSTSAYSLGAQYCPITPQPALTECVQVYAVPLAPFTDPQGGTLTVQSTGLKSCTGGSNPSVCW